MAGGERRRKEGKGGGRRRKEGKEGDEMTGGVRGREPLVRVVMSLKGRQCAV